MPLIKLTIDQQNALLQAHLQLDAYEVVCQGKDGDKAVRVPYKLGAERRTVAKNINVLRTSLNVWSETRKGILKECIPDATESAELDDLKKKYPEEYAKFIATATAAASKEDEINLLSFTMKAIYEQASEMPLMAIATLEEHGLID